jgi:hypothetical protein
MDSRQLLSATGGNTGNLAFQFAISNHLAGPVPTLSWDAPAKQIRDAGDILVLPLANQLGAHTDLSRLAARLDEINLPVVGVGLGAQAKLLGVDIQLTSGTEEWLKALVRLAPNGGANIGVRGEYTQGQILRYCPGAATVVIGCPSNFINMTDDIASRIAAGFTRRPKLIAVASGIPYIPALARIEQDLASIVTNTGGAYIVQHGIEMLQLARNEFDQMAPGVLDICHRYIAPELSLEDFKAWCRRYAYTFGGVWAWMDFLKRFDFVIGTRLHGAILALQAGVPAGCIAHDSRTLELCQTIGIPVRRYSDIGSLNANNVLEYFEFDKQQFIETRRELLRRYLGVYQSAEIEVKAELLQGLRAAA